MITAGSVMYGPPSPGQQVMIGSESRLGGSSTISWQGPDDTDLGRESASDFSRPSARSLSIMPSGGAISSTSETRSPSWSRSSTPNAMQALRRVPNWLITTGSWEPLTLRKKSAGPPALTVRSVISVISRCGSTSASTSCNSPAARR